MDLILLAAGDSKRYGSNKLLEYIDGKKMYVYAYELYVDIKNIKNRVLVSQYDEILEYFSSRGFRCVKNDKSYLGISHSIGLGMLELEKQYKDKDDPDKYKENGTIFAVCDQPFLKAATVQRLMKEYLLSNKSIATLRYNERLGNPRIYSRLYAKDLLKLSGDVGGKQVMNRNIEEVYYCDIDDEKEILDIDNKKDKEIAMENKKDEIKLTKLAKCGGCGAKVGAGVLAKLLADIKVHHDKNLLVGFDKSDDASVYKISEDLAIVQTMDFFPPIVDDPYTFGQIAATNALSDVYAMGGEAKLAMNIMCVPEDLDKKYVHEMLRGGYDKAYEAGALITGGHSIHDEEPKYGLSVTGFVHPDKVLTNSASKVGDVLFLTKPLGIGIISTAAKADLVSEETKKKALELMCTLNKYARDIMVKYPVNSCTDVTGFGLMGHSLEMAKGSDVKIIIDTKSLPILEEVSKLAKNGILPKGLYRNREFAQEFVEVFDVDLAIQDICFDPQTSGGLLISIPEEYAKFLEEELLKVCPYTSRIGRVVEYKSGARIELR